MYIIYIKAVVRFDRLYFFLEELIFFLDFLHHITKPAVRIQSCLVPLPQDTQHSVNALMWINRLIAQFSKLKPWTNFNGFSLCTTTKPLQNQIGDRPCH